MPYIGAGLSRFNTADQLTVTGDAEFNGNVDLQDNDKLLIGTSDDLQIFHNGSNSVIEDLGTGNLKIKSNGSGINFQKGDAELLATMATDDAVTLYHANTARIYTQSHGARIDGGLRFASSGAASDTSNPYIFRSSGADNMVFATGSTERMRLTSAGRLGIGTASPSEPLHISSTSGAAAVFERTDSASVGIRLLGNGMSASTAPKISAESGPDMAFTVNNGERMRIDASGNVGINTTPTQKLHVAGNAIVTGIARLGDGSVSAPAYQFLNDTNSGMFRPASDSLAFSTGGTERMRLTDVFMVGKTAAGFDNVGFQVTMDGQAAFTRDNAVPLYVNRQTSEGNTLEIRQDNDPQLILGSKFSGRGYISSNVANSTGIRFDTNFIAPCDATGANRNNAIDVGSSGARFKDGFFANAVKGRYFQNQDDTNTFMEFPTGDIIKFATGGSERARFDASGNLLLGTSSHFSQGERLAISYNYLSGTGIVIDSGSGGGAAMRFRTNSSLVGSIITTTSSTGYNTSSDRRLKSNIEDAASASDKIDAIQVRQFDWNVDDSHQDYGLIAQELQPIEPMAVTGDADSDEMMSVDYSKLVPMLIKEIQELRSRVATLEAS